MKKRITMFLAAAMAAMCATADPVVTDVVAKQRYPWNGLVDITCKVTGITGAASEGIEHDFFVAAVMPDSGDVRNISQFWVVQNGTNSTDRVVRVNGNYHLLFDALAALGQVSSDNMVIRVTVKTHVKSQLWEGGPYWADMNIGADACEDCGYYFWWGDTIGYRRENDRWIASDGSTSNFTFSSITSPRDNVLTRKNDAAHVHWGGSWRMPTRWEMDNLISLCDWTWTTMNGINGYVVKGRGDYAHASIFLPCTAIGYYYGSVGYYWSSARSTGNSFGYSWGLVFSQSTKSTSDQDYFDSGHPVRPVQGFTN